MNKTGSAAKVKLNSFDDLFGDGQPQAGIEQVQVIALSELHLVFFKGKDADVIAQAFKEFVKVNEKKQQRPSLRQKLKGLQKIVAQNKNKERSREKNKDKGQSL